MTSQTELIQFLKALVSKIQIGIITFDIEGYITMINQQAICFLHLEGKVSDYIDVPILDCIRIDLLNNKIATCLSTSRQDFHISNFTVADKYFFVDGVKLLDGMLITISNVTDTFVSKGRATQSLLVGIESERRRLAKDIHDGVGPNMSTLKLQIDAVKRKLTDDFAIQGLNRINTSISEIASDIRQISHDLMPSSLIDYGVITALNNYANRINETDNVNINYQPSISDKYLSREHELNIYRIIQELVNNALKYAACTNIDILIKEEEGKIIIKVEDDGKGMIMDEPHYTGNGLYNIQTRVESFQGKFEIISQLGQGVSAIIELPITPQTI
jgi:signal transduction histidine kinase